jgi:hypothetical protein
MRHGGDVGTALCQLGRRLGDQQRVNQRLVALHIDHDRCRHSSRWQLDHLGQAIGAAGVIGTGQQGAQAVALGRGQHFRMVGGHQHLVGARQQRPLGDAHDHRLAAEIEQGLAGKRVDA